MPPLADVVPSLHGQDLLTQNDAPLSPRKESYKRVPPTPPYRGSG